MRRDTKEIDGVRYVLIEERELQRLERIAARVVENKRDAEELPSLPSADAQGRRSAVEFARVSIAREIIRERRTAGLTQQELARLAGVRQETISRIESGKHSPTVRTVERIDAVLQAALRRRKGVGMKRPVSRKSRARS